MKVFSWNDIQVFLNTGKPIDFFEKGTGISVGSFDGLHLGHRKLLCELVTECRKFNLLPGVISFTRPLPSLKHSADYSGDISTLNQRLKLFEELGIEFAIIIDFNEEFASILGTDFLNILVNACNMQFIAEGVDFRFGYKGATDVQAIKYFAEKNNIKTSFVDQVIFNQDYEEEKRISSSIIREMILKGFFATVKTLLNRPYEIELKGHYELKNQSKIYKKSDFVQIIPPNGIYHCKTQSNSDVRVQITDNSLVVEPADKSDILSLIFY